MLAFYFLAAIVIWLGILSLRGGFAFAAYVRQDLNSPASDFTPFVSVFAPFRGLDEGIEQSLMTLFQQDYPQYEIIFVTDRDDDPSVTVVRKLSDTHPEIASKLIIAGPASASGQKVHNLRIAVNSAATRAEIFAFVDSDARPGKTWLRTLVAPLADEQVGAATGYRWFVPLGLNVASQLRAVWNASIASALGQAREKNFCWGGSTAIRRSTFEAVNIREHWRGTVSDDFAVTKALHEAKLPIHFVPACLVPAVDDCTFSELFEFTNRQLKITHVYMPHLWKAMLLGSFMFCLLFFGGWILPIFRAINHRPIVIPLSLLLVIFLLGPLKAHVRLRAVMAALPQYRWALRRGWIFHVLVWPLTSALYLWNGVVAACSRRIQWRGITYELRSATEAVIIKSNKL